MFKTLDGWSSFPSDHAVLYFAMSTGIFYFSNRAGVLALLYTVVFICFPRIYVGLHYPGDIIAGALLGIGIALAGNHVLPRNKHIRGLSGLSYTQPKYFYPVFYIVMQQFSEMFHSSREILGRLSSAFFMVLT